MIQILSTIDSSIDPIESWILEPTAGLKDVEDATRWLGGLNPIIGGVLWIEALRQC